MTITVAPIAVAHRRTRTSRSTDVQHYLPRLVLAPSFLLVLVFVYGFNLWTFFLSFTNSKAFASSTLVGLANYQKLWTWTFETDPPSSWYTAIVNMGIFGGLYVAICLVLGLTLAILLDQKIRGEGILRPIYLYPLALSFIVTGTAWKLFLDPRIGLEKAVHDWGWTSFHFDWVVNPRMMIYCVAIAGIWQTSGFVMAMFLAGLRGIDGEILKAAQIDGASAFATYWRIVLPIMRPVFLSAIDHPHPYGDQVLRPGALGDRQEPRRRGRAAVDLHVFLHLHPQPDGGRLDERGHHADDHRGDHGPLSLFRAAGEESMSAADRRRFRARARAGPSLADDAHRHLRPAGPFRRSSTSCRSSSW